MHLLYVFLGCAAFFLCGYAYPIYPTTGEQIMDPGDDICFDNPTPIPPTPFFDQYYTTVLVSNNGVLTLGNPAECIETYTPDPFPTSSQPLIGVYWGDVDTSGAGGGSTGFKVVLGASPIDYFAGFTATHWIQASWVAVGYYEAATDRLNTFQGIVASDGSSTVACFQYPTAGELGNTEGGLDWTTGDASGGSGGLDGVPAQVGFDAGDFTNYYSHPDSQTDAVRRIDGSGGGATPVGGVGAGGGIGQFCYSIADLTITIGGDPHAYDIGGHVFEIPLFDFKEVLYRIHNDSSVDVTARIGNMAFISQVEVKRNGLPYISAVIENGDPIFIVNGNRLSTPGVYEAGTVELYRAKDYSINKWKFGLLELQRYHEQVLHVPGVITIVSGINPQAGFFNLEVLSPPTRSVPESVVSIVHHFHTHHKRDSNAFASAIIIE